MTEEMSFQVSLKSSGIQYSGIELSVSIFSLFLKVMKTLTLSLYFAIWANENAKKHICGPLPFTALEVSSAAEKPGNVKKVHLLMFLGTK